MKVKTDLKTAKKGDYVKIRRTVFLVREVIDGSSLVLALPEKEVEDERD